jgi:molecular chaperone HtpG
VEQVNVADLSENFEALSLDERDRVFEFVKLADRVLQPYRCSVEIKKFQPAQLPALFTSNDAANFLRSVEQSKEVADELWSGVLDGLAEEPAASAYAQLCLNYSNRLVRKIARLKHRGLIQRSVEMLYVQSLLLGHYPLKSKEMQLLNEGLLGLIELGIDAQTGEEGAE